MGTTDGSSNTDGTGGSEVPMVELTLERFQAALRSTFRVCLENERHINLTLVEAQAVRSPSGGEGAESFSILFAGPADPLLPQRIYRVANDAMGEFDLFMVPVARESDGYRYQAIFNRQPVTA
jgi:hypothetical protein